MTLIFRDEAQPSDSKRVREIVESTSFFADHEVDVAVELVEERLKRGAASGYEFVFAEQAGKVVGYSCFGEIPCTRHRYDIYWIAVDNTDRGQGLGRKILAEAERRIAERGGVKIYVETGGKPQYQPTRDFYIRNGYEVVAVLDDFYCEGDAKLILHKTL